jgi:virginiamycin B lyase
MLRCTARRCAVRSDAAPAIRPPRKRHAIAAQRLRSGCTAVTKWSRRPPGCLERSPVRPLRLNNLLLPAAVLLAVLLTVLFAVPQPAAAQPAGAARLREFPVPSGSHPHDVAPAPDGSVWYTGQHVGKLGRLDPRSGRVTEVALGEGSAPHGVIVGPDGAAWVTDSGLNAIVRVDPATHAVRRFPLPGGNANLNTAVFDTHGTLWFTGQSGIYGRLDPASGRVEVFQAPRGYGPYGITATPDGSVYYASLAGSYVGHIKPPATAVTVLEPPSAGQGARRVWSDSAGRVWVSEWNAGKLARYDPVHGQWREWPLPGRSPRPYALYVDAQDQVWLSDWGANAIVRFDPATERFESFPVPSAGSTIRQMLGRPGEVWAAASGVDKLVVITTGP